MFQSYSTIVNVDTSFENEVVSLLKMKQQFWNILRCINIGSQVLMRIYLKKYIEHIQTSIQHDFTANKSLFTNLLDSLPRSFQEVSFSCIHFLEVVVNAFRNSQQIVAVCTDVAKTYKVELQIFIAKINSYGVIDPLNFTCLYSNITCLNSL